MTQLPCTTLYASSRINEERTTLQITAMRRTTGGIPVRGMTSTTDLESNEEEEEGGGKEVEQIRDLLGDRENAHFLQMDDAASRWPLFLDFIE